MLTNDVRRNAMRRRAYAASRSMTWAQTAKRYAAVFESAHQRGRAGLARPLNSVVPPDTTIAIPEVRTGHFLSLCDSTGMLQHAIHSVADRAHGYCVIQVIGLRQKREIGPSLGRCRR